MRNVKDRRIEERNLHRLYIKDMKEYLCQILYLRNIYKDLIKKSQRITFKIVSHAASNQLLFSFLVSFWTHFHAQQARPSSTVSFAN